MLMFKFLKKNKSTVKRKMEASKTTERLNILEMETQLSEMHWGLNDIETALMNLKTQNRLFLDTGTKKRQRKLTISVTYETRSRT